MKMFFMKIMNCTQIHNFIRSLPTIGILPT